MGFSQIESFLEKHIEGFFTKKFGSELEDVEIAQKLEREISYKRRKTRGGYLVPNAYRIVMCASDYERLAAQRLVENLICLAEKLVIRKDYYLAGQLSIELQKDEKLSVGMCEIVSFHQQEKTEAELLQESHTIVLQKDKFKKPINLPVIHNLTVLRVLEGIDEGAYLEFGERQIYIGRQETNDLVLSDNSMSRMHAYITYEKHRHILHDAQSLNGTFAGESRVTEYCLQHGDEIRMGNTVLRYEVI